MQAGASNVPLVHVVDDDELIVQELSALLGSVGYEHCGYSNSESFLAAVNNERPGCVLLDIMMPDRDGLQVQAELEERDIALPVIFVSGQQSLDLAVEAMRGGAFDYIVKPVRYQALLDTINPAIRLSCRRWQHAEMQASVRDKLSWLTARERDVLELLAAGEERQSIAQRLGVSMRTIEMHRANIMGKMGAQSFAELVRMCVAVGLA